MIRAAAWVVDQEIRAAKWAGIDFTGKPDAVAYFALVSSPFLAGISVTPYYGMYQTQVAASWAVKDIAHTKRAGGAVRGLHNWHPRALAFAQRGGWRFAATKVGSRFIPYVGWALFAYDLWNVGKWIGEKTSPV